ncbi:hypothetical protein BLNAU_17621 [Blattamonas nauphoetae]|uniref:DDE-1 domain-containing protein n=1 Tax=Blattamonas nauphoetae TaxID=2049346 RepID=A0ABQ9XB13_9EUKA|nr:hypothetical protein BLNAU_17621 [Blattamonas nauphoetae]
MEELAGQGIDVVILPAHTSHFLQPLDLGVNAAFKSALTGLEFPTKSEFREKCKPFFYKVRDAIHTATQAKYILAGWDRSGLFNEKRQKQILEELDQVGGVPPSRGFSLGGEVITSQEVLHRWKEHETRKTKKGRQKRQTKKVQVDNSSESGCDSASIVSDTEYETEEDCIVEVGGSDIDEEDTIAEKITSMINERVQTPSSQWSRQIRTPARFLQASSLEMGKQAKNKSPGQIAKEKWLDKLNSGSNDVNSDFFFEQLDLEDNGVKYTEMRLSENTRLSADFYPSDKQTEPLPLSSNSPLFFRVLHANSTVQHG